MIFNVWGKGEEEAKDVSKLASGISYWWKLCMDR